MIKFQIHGEVRLNITFGKTTYHHVAYVTDISDLFMLGLDLLKENNFKLDFLKGDNFKLDFKSKELHPMSEEHRIV